MTIRVILNLYDRNNAYPTVRYSAKDRNYSDFRFQAPRVNQYPMSTKKRNLPEPSMEISTPTSSNTQQHDQEEIPTNAKREKFRTY